MTPAEDADPGYAMIEIMHASLSPPDREVLDRLLATPGFQARLEFLRKRGVDPTLEEWLHFADGRAAAGHPLSHHVTAEIWASVTADKWTRRTARERTLRLTRLLGPPDIVFEKWYGSTLTWSLTREEFWVVNAEVPVKLQCT